MKKLTLAAFAICAVWVYGIGLVALSNASELAAAGMIFLQAAAFTIIAKA